MRLLSDLGIENWGTVVFSSVLYDPGPGTFVSLAKLARFYFPKIFDLASKVVSL